MSIQALDHLRIAVQETWPTPAIGHEETQENWQQEILCQLEHIESVAQKLIDACEVALQYFEDTRHGREWTQNGGLEAENLRSALAEARGEQPDGEEAEDADGD